MFVDKLNFIIITGLSGGGKTLALQSLEDMGFFCVDNLPPTFLEKFADLCVQSEGKVSKVAVVCDLRGGEFFASLSEALNDLEKVGINYEILFFEASDEVLVNRYKESRRRHPVSPQGSILEGIHMEREQLAELRGKAHRVFDSSDLTARQMKDKIRVLFGKNNDPARMTISVMSFGFKYGIPMDADTIIDVRFLPNPFYVEKLKPLTGKARLVKDYIFSSEVTTLFIEKFFSLIEFIIPYYLKEGKNHLVIGIGCTGGKHRSVAVAERTAEFLRERKYFCIVNHRDMELD
ncbi:MAG: RNase adapter RapZ [Eubacteriales bacterium]